MRINYDIIAQVIDNLRGSYTSQNHRKEKSQMQFSLVRLGMKFKKWLCTALQNTFNDCCEFFKICLRTKFEKYYSKS